MICQGANPGLVSSWSRRAALELARAVGLERGRPPRRPRAGRELFRELGIRTIQISEHDSQVSRTPKAAGEFVGTWSVDGFLGEGSQPAELGWGTGGGRAAAGRAAAAGRGPGIYLLRPGIDVRVRSWSPAAGPFVGYLITHMESLSIADHLTLREAGRIVYRPTVHYAYCPCPDSVLSVHELVGRGFEPQPRQRILAADIVQRPGRARRAAGRPSAGRLLVRLAALDRGGARDRAPRQRHGAAGRGRHPGRHGGGDRAPSRTWAWSSPRQLDFALVLAIARPYLGRLLGAWSDWTPLTGRGRLFPEALDRSDPWRFANVRVA